MHAPGCGWSKLPGIAANLCLACTGSTSRMLKLKDWPPNSSFRSKLPRHNQDFVEMLPMPEYTHPTAGPLNLATKLPFWINPPDLGPKAYIAYGRSAHHLHRTATPIADCNQCMHEPGVARRGGH